MLMLILVSVMERKLGDLDAILDDEWGRGRGERGGVSEKKAGGERMKSKSGGPGEEAGEGLSEEDSEPLTWSERRERRGPREPK
eukprot:1031960-Rhodomonas_salina.1